jgi:integrase/recombinase XerD
VTGKMLDKLFEQFILEKTYIRNCAQNTIQYYWMAFKTYEKVIPHLNLPDKQTLTNFVVGVRENGMPVGCANTYIRALNSFLSWMYENEHLKEPLQIKQLKQEKKVMRSFTGAELKRIVSYRPKRFTGARLHALICTLIDTGCRIEEVITLRRDKVNFDSMLIELVGKGSKERVVPISIELCKILFKFLNRHEFDYVFPKKCPSSRNRNKCTEPKN